MSTHTHTHTRVAIPTYTRAHCLYLIFSKCFPALSLAWSTSAPQSGSHSEKSAPTCTEQPFSSLAVCTKNLPLVKSLLLDLIHRRPSHVPPHPPNLCVEALTPCSKGRSRHLSLCTRTWGVSLRPARLHTANDTQKVLRNPATARRDRKMEAP